MLHKLLNRLFSFFPRSLPTGMAQFNQWVTDVIELSGLPDNESTQRLAAQFILQLHPSIGHVPMREVSKRLIKAAATQVAIEVIKLQDEQHKQQQLSSTAS